MTQTGPRPVGRIDEGKEGSDHAAAGRRSNRKLDEKIRRTALEILGRKVYADFGPTLAPEYLAKKHGIVAGRETLWTWMIEGQLWQARSQGLGHFYFALTGQRYCPAVPVWRKHFPETFVWIMPVWRQAEKLAGRGDGRV